MQERVRKYRSHLLSLWILNEYLEHGVYKNEYQMDLIEWCKIMYSAMLTMGESKRLWEMLKNVDCSFMVENIEVEEYAYFLRERKWSIGSFQTYDS